MAELVGGAALGAFLQVLFERLANPLIARFKGVYGVEKDLENLGQTVSAIRALLHDADARKVRGAAVDLWLSKLKDAAYDADDVLDDFYYEILQHKVAEGIGASGLQEKEEEWQQRPKPRKRDKVRKAFSSIRPGNWRFRHRLSQEIRQISDRLKTIMNNSHFKLDPSPVLEVNGRSLSSRNSRETSSFFSDPHVFGRESESDEIVKLCLGVSEDVHPSVLPIVGIPGIGKTTFAQVVYNDKRVKDHFDLMMWVCVGNDFEVMKLTEQIFEYVASTQDKSRGFGNLNVIQVMLGKKLEGRRFLLVLDDVWDVNRDEWQKLRAPLICGQKGSVVLATTRNNSVAKAMGTLKPIKLEGLSFEDCLSLIKKCVPAAAHCDALSNQILGKICSEIVDKLTGVPLAVKTIGSFLSSKDEESWRDVLEMEIWELPQGDGGILPVSRLSYEQLPLHLKACFAYCSLFPKNHEFVKSDLVKLWMASGYVEAKKGKRLEDAGSDYFDELCNRSFFVKIDDRYFMPGVCHELAQAISCHECTRVEDGNWKNALVKKCYHLSFSHDIIDNLSATTLHSLLYISHFGSTLFKLTPDLLHRLSHLRVLDLSGSNINHLPTSIGDLRHLRFLGLNFTRIAELPESISKLYNLFSLQLNKCSYLNEIHNNVTNLLNLRHLNASQKLLSGLPKIGKLIHLQELEQFIVSREDGYKIVELRKMNGLRGRIHILNLENAENEDEAGQASLKEKKYLDVLSLEWSDDRSSDVRKTNMELERKVLEVLQPPINLKDLSIKGNGGSEFPNWLKPHFVNNLKSISLHNIKNWKALPTLGNLQFLQYLKIQYLLSVEKVGPEFYGEDVFPSLKVLKLRHMHQWQDWWTSECHFPKLQEFFIEDCPKLQNIILPKSLISLKIEKCPMLLANTNFTLLQRLHSLHSLSCSLESSYPDLASCVCNALQHLVTLEGLEIYYYGEHLTESRWSMRPSWMPYSFSGGRAADEINLMDRVLSIHDGSDTRIFLLYAHNFPEYIAVFRRDVSIYIRNYRDDFHDCQSLSICLENNLTSLQRLSINGCQNIAFLLKESVFLHLTKLEKLEIVDCRNPMELQWFPQHEINSLKFLSICKCPDLMHFRRSKMIGLVELQVKYCENLTSMDLQELVSLKSLEIVECPQLTSSIFTHKLTNLQELRIRKCPRVFSFSRYTESYLENLSSLQLLEIRNCNNLKQLPTNLQDLYSLKRLLVMHCPEIQSLPESGLPSSVDELCIEGCPSLQERCQRGGPDWSMIADIPKRTISCAKCYPWGCRCSYQ